MRDRVLELLREAVARVAREAGAEVEPLVARVSLGPSRSPEHGDFASNAALVLAGPLGAKPLELAERIAAELAGPEAGIDRVEVAPPGFINLFLARGEWDAVVRRALVEGARYGLSGAGGGERVQVEFVSANPTGPLTIGHGRNAVLGDSIARLLEAAGHDVTREYYFNDGGRQMRLLAQSLRARYLQRLGRDAELPEGGYSGDYLGAIAERLVEEQGDAWVDSDEAGFRARAEAAIFASIRATLKRLGIHFDSYYNERTLYEDGRVEEALAELRDHGLVFEEEGATWLRGEGFGLARDRVLIRSSGEPTYLLPDIAYHREKFRRGFQRAIDVLGPDHLEQFPYARAAAGALGCDAERIEVVHYQWVNLRRGGELVKMSTRKASFVTIDEVLDEVGPDVFRFFMLDRRADTHLDFDLDLAKERSERNPVYKIQYAHARLCSIERRAAESGLELPAPEALPLERLESPEERELAKRVGRYPQVVLRAAQAREPQELSRYLLELATAFHTYVSDGRRHRVLSEDRELSLARLALARSVRTPLGNGLALLGIGAPERM